VDISSDLPQPIPSAVTTACLDPTASDTGGAVINEPVHGAGGRDLPARPIPEGRLVRPIRRLDDPEILQRVLAGLLSLQ